MKTTTGYLRPVGLIAGLLLIVLGVSSLQAQPVQRRGFSVKITEPANQEFVYGKTRIAADVEIDAIQDLDRVEFVVGDKVVFIDREAPCECIHDFGEESKSHVIRAVAHHVEELTVEDAIITRKVTFSAFEQVNRVILWVTVTDKDDNLITDLTQEQFRVYEDGDPQKIIDFYPEDRKITMAILVDTSGSMLDKMSEVHKASASFVETLRPEDQALVIDFDDKVFLIQDLTNDHKELQTAITSTKPMGQTSIYDALHASYRKIGKIDGRKAIILLSDGEDTSSLFSFDRVLEEAKGNNTMIYTIGLGSRIDRGVLKRFASFTGGRAFFVEDASELAEVYARIAAELRTQYYLTYSTDNDEWDGRWIKIKVDAPDTDLRIRARRGYFAVRSPGKGGGSGSTGP